MKFFGGFFRKKTPEQKQIIQTQKEIDARNILCFNCNHAMEFHTTSHTEGTACLVRHCDCKEFD